MSFNNPQKPQQVVYGTPESHVWTDAVSFQAQWFFSINKQAKSDLQKVVDMKL